MIRQWALALVLPCVFSCSSLPRTDAPRRERDAPIPVIDAHTHTIFLPEVDPTLGRAPTQDEYLKERRDSGIIASVANTRVNETDFVDLSAKGVFRCGGVGDGTNWDRLEESLRSKRYICLKISLGYVHRYASDPIYKRAYGLAKKYDVPVVFHTGDTSSPRAKLKYADPLTIDEIAVDYPEVRFVIAHLGNPWIESAAEVAYKNPNVYLDGSALLAGDVSKRTPEYLEEYMLKPIRWVLGYIDDPKKLMFGTDWPVVYMPAYLETFKKAVPREHWEAVFHDNAIRVFKLPMTPLRRK